MNSENEDSKDLGKADTSRFSPFRNPQQNWSQKQLLLWGHGSAAKEACTDGSHFQKEKQHHKLLPSSLSLGFKGETSKHTGYEREMA